MAAVTGTREIAHVERIGGAAPVAAASSSSSSWVSIASAGPDKVKKDIAKIELFFEAKSFGYAASLAEGTLKGPIPDPKDKIRLYRLLIDILSQAGAKREAEARIDEALGLHFPDAKDKVYFIYLKALFLLDRDLHQDAITLAKSGLDQLKKGDDESCLFYYVLAFAYMGQDQFPAMEEAIKSGLKTKWHDPEIIGELAVLRVQHIHGEANFQKLDKVARKLLKRKMDVDSQATLLYYIAVASQMLDKPQVGYEKAKEGLKLACSNDVKGLLREAMCLCDPKRFQQEEKKEEAPKIPKPRTMAQALLLLSPYLDNEANAEAFRQMVNDVADMQA